MKKKLYNSKEPANVPYSNEEPHMGIWNDDVCILFEDSNECRSDRVDKFKIR